jgi:hypothetical protein
MPATDHHQPVFNERYARHHSCGQAAKAKACYETRSDDPDPCPAGFAATVVRVCNKPLLLHYVSTTKTNSEIWSTTGNFRKATSWRTTTALRPCRMRIWSAITHGDTREFLFSPEGWYDGRQCLLGDSSGRELIQQYAMPTYRNPHHRMV